MGYFNFKNNITPVNDTNLNAMQKGLMETIFRVNGLPYITPNKDENPADILGFGIWERIEGKVLVGIDEDDKDFNEIGKSGGEKTHVITIPELPDHSHTLNTSSKDGTHLDGFFKVGSYEQDNTNMATKGVGENEPHNNLQPYRVVGYMWIRTA